MAEAAAQERIGGMKFAEQQLLRHGWEQGKGLGRGENGISEAIKVKVKCDKAGFGHKESEQFTFHWWDHVFNKASASLTVETEQSGVVVRKTDGEEEAVISNKKPRKAMLNKSALYGRFVKSATLLSGQKQPEYKPSSSDDSSSEDDEKLDLSSTKQLTDAELMKVCGGRTAHKGARHGFNMSAKLARLEQQEQEFMAKYGKTPQPVAEAVIAEPAQDQKTEKSNLRKSKKRKQESKEPLQNGTFEQNNMSETIQSQFKGQELSTDELVSSTLCNRNIQSDTKKKKKKRKREQKTDTPEEAEQSSTLDVDGKDELQHEVPSLTIEQLHNTDAVLKKEKRKKKKSSRKMDSSLIEERQNEAAALHDDLSDSQEGDEQQHEDGSVTQPAPEIVAKKKKKKKSCKKDKSLTAEEQQHCHDASDEQRSAKKPEKSKKKTVKQEPKYESVDEPVKKKKKSKKSQM